MNDKGNDGGPPPRRTATKIVNAGRDPKSYHGFVNPPVYHASTVLYPNAEDFLAHRARYQYGRRGTPTTEALELALQELEGPQCAGVSLLPSGLAAISAALLSVVHAGDHVLVTDSAYGPTRTFCGQILTRLGVSHDLLRSRHRRRDRRADQAEHARHLSGIAGLALLSKCRTSRRSPKPRMKSHSSQGRAGADGQYLGDPALFPPARPRRRSRRSRPAPNISAAIPT